MVKGALPLGARLNRHVLRSTLGRRPAALVVNLGGGDVAVAEELLHLGEVDAGVEQSVAVVARSECGL